MNVKRLAVIPSDPIAEYLKGGYDPDWLRAYYNPKRFFDEVYLLSPEEKNQSDLLGMKVIKTSPKELPSRIKDLKIDVVRAYGGNWACRMACSHKVKNVPVIVSVHDTNPDILYDHIKDADYVFCVSKAVMRVVQEKTRRSDNIWILPNRVDFQIMRAIPNEEIFKKFPFTHRIVHVGRLTSQKNLDTLLYALKELDEQYCVMAIGNGDRKEYEQLAARLNIQHRCFFLNAVSHQQLAQYFSSATCMCTPSRWEGFGMVFIEALACSSVVVTSDIAPMNEYIHDRHNGFLVKEYENPARLAEAIREACTHAALRMQIQKNARKSVESFERTRIDQLEANYYQNVLQQKEAIKNG